MSDKPKKKRCDRCGEKPVKCLSQDVGFYTLVCQSCSKLTASEPSGKREKRDISKPGIYEAEFPE